MLNSFNLILGYLVFKNSQNPAVLCLGSLNYFSNMSFAHTYVTLRSDYILQSFNQIAYSRATIRFHIPEFQNFIWNGIN